MNPIDVISPPPLPLWQLELCAHVFLDVSARSGAPAEEVPPPTIPRLGVSLQLPRRLGGARDDAHSVEWYGLGPHENYPDRRSAACLGVWRLPVEAMHTPYVVPRCVTLGLDVI